MTRMQQVAAECRSLSASLPTDGAGLPETEANRVLGRTLELLAEVAERLDQLGQKIGRMENRR